MNSKFRVWDGEQMHLPPHDYVLAGDGDVLLCLPYVEKLGVHHNSGKVNIGVPHENHEVMHYTGLDDAEGTPVYEGDICEYEHYCMEPTIKRFVVEYNVDNMQWERHHIDKHMRGKRVKMSYVRAAERNGLTVVGNKFQTTELLD